MSYFGLAATGSTPDANGNTRGLLVLNHENITQAYLHPNGATSTGGAMAGTGGGTITGRGTNGAIGVLTRTAPAPGSPGKRGHMPCASARRLMDAALPFTPSYIQ